MEKNISLYLGEKMELKKLISKKIFFHFKILKGYIFKERKRKEQEKRRKMMMMDEPDQSSAIALDSYLKLVSKLNEK